MVKNADSKHSSRKIKTGILVLQLNSYRGIHWETLENPITESLVMLNFFKQSSKIRLHIEEYL